jgi:predicted RND superfamily exporter protein
MKPTFFARRPLVPFLPDWITNSLLVLVVVFFLVPFAFRGARMSLQKMKNDVKDWLPADFAETKELDWFREHFLGEQFIVMTWPGCNADDDRYKMMVEKLKHELAPPSNSKSASDTDDAKLDQDETTNVATKSGGQAANDNGVNGDNKEHDEEYQRARKNGDRLGLYTAGKYHENWGGLDEKWLQGDNDVWYYITPDGKFYKWTGDNNALHGMVRAVERLFRGKNSVEGKWEATFGATADGSPSEYHKDPRMLTARLFKTMTTGPQVLERLAGPGGPLWPRGVTDPQEASEIAHKLAHERLEGTLFGPDGKQTCILVTLSDAGRRDLSRVVGRPVMGKPRGKILDLAIGECGIPMEDLHLGGPPVDNVAIDEEGTITLLRLVGFCAMIGLGLSYLFFRSTLVTCMLFFVGGVSAISSLSIVWWGGSTVDAILLSMPSLVYVLGLSGAVHIVNYYRDAVNKSGPDGAAEKALSHGWGPCTLAAFTTALGLISLYSSNIQPIKKFGLFSAIGTMATLILLFTYLPAALHMFPPGYKKRSEDEENSPGHGLNQFLKTFWDKFGSWIIRRHGWVTAGCIAVTIGVGVGLFQINTSVQLLKLFDGNAKIIKDYEWLEVHLGKLVPMELAIRVAPEAMLPTIEELKNSPSRDLAKERLQLNILERLEIADHVQKVVEEEFGEAGQGVVGRGMSAATFAPPLPAAGGGLVSERSAFVPKLEQSRDELLQTDYLRMDKDNGRELWRVSLRLGALSDIDYGDFVYEFKAVVEPVMAAYRYRLQVLETLDRIHAADGGNTSSVYILGADPKKYETAATAKPPIATVADSDSAATPTAGAAKEKHAIDQTKIFAQALNDLLVNRGFRRGSSFKTRIDWHDPELYPMKDGLATSEQWAARLAQFDCVVITSHHPDYDLDFIKKHAKQVIDASDHQFNSRAADARTAAMRMDAGDPYSQVSVIYTGVVPVVYKAQRTLLNSLVNSIGLAFVMIALVMMVLLRDWGRPVGLGNTINVTGGLVSMLPNVFPVILIFGAMGHMRILVDIGSMMTASVAMGVAVDDTIHFLNWFRTGLSQGMTRNQAILLGYRRCATAMTQTTIIGGLGLFVFALSTFTPTQRFGVLMLALLVAALIGDLIMLPALLAGPLGRFFEVAKKTAATAPPAAMQPAAATSEVSESLPARASTPHSSARTDAPPAVLRHDKGHRRVP